MTDPWPAARVGASVLSLITGLYYLVVAFGNVTSPGENWQFVKGVMSLDGVPAGSGYGWRAVNSPVLQGAAYAAIIMGEFIAGALLSLGALRGLAVRASGHRWCRVQWMTIYGATSGLGVFYFLFIVIGGNWFAMYLNDTWNGLDVAYQNSMLTTTTLLVTLVTARLSQDSEM